VGSVGLISGRGKVGTAWVRVLSKIVFTPGGIVVNTCTCLDGSFNFLGGVKVSSFLIGLRLLLNGRGKLGEKFTDLGGIEMYFQRPNSGSSFNSKKN